MSSIEPEENAQVTASNAVEETQPRGNLQQSESPHSTGTNSAHQLNPNPCTQVQRKPYKMFIPGRGLVPISEVAENVVIKNSNKPRSRKRFWYIWTMGTFQEDCSKVLEDWYTELFTVRTIDDFSRQYFELKPPSQLEFGCDYSLFRRGKNPFWQDEKNSKGGRWVITASKAMGTDLDVLWCDVMVLLMEDAFRDSRSEVVGATLHIGFAKNFVSVWTAHSEYSGAVLSIGMRLASFLGLEPNSLKYQTHKSMVSQHSTVKPIHVL